MRLRYWFTPLGLYCLFWRVTGALLAALFPLLIGLADVWLRNSPRNTFFKKGVWVEPKDATPTPTVTDVTRHFRQPLRLNLTEPVRVTDARHSRNAQ